MILLSPMERTICKYFLDKNENIYVVDNQNILYIHDDNMYYPFMKILGNIKKCFQMYNNFYVYHDDTLTVFDINLMEIKCHQSLIIYDENHNTYKEQHWIPQNITDIDYNPQLSIIATMKNNDLSVYFGINRNDDDDELEDVHITNLKKKYLSVKIIDKLLLASQKDCCDVYILSHRSVIYSATIKIKGDIVPLITDFVNDDFILTTGDRLSITGELILSNMKYIKGDMFKHNIYLVKETNSLLCYHNQTTYDFVVEPLTHILPVIKIQKKETNYTPATELILPQDTDLQIESLGSTQVLVYDKKIYLLNGVLIELIFNDQKIFYDNIHNYIEKSETNLVIDICVSRPIIEQLMQIIPNIYRLNNEMLYCFEQLDVGGEVVSYGTGVTRHVFNILRKELEEAFDKKLAGHDNNSAHNLGKLLYFCNREGNETFMNIDPYFFYLMSKESDYLTLLKKFKGENYPMYHKQITLYKNNPEKLSELDLGISTHFEYIKFLMSSNLTKEQCVLYEQLCKGFCYFARRNKLYKIIVNLPVDYYIKTIVAKKYFDAKLEFSLKDQTINPHLFKQFRIFFKKIFMGLSPEQKSIFMQNVTGSQYFGETINIVFAYDEHKIITKPAIYSEPITVQSIPNSITDLIYEITKPEPLVLEYEISTCEARITFNMEPTQDNIKHLLNFLTIEDLSIKN